MKPFIPRIHSKLHKTGLTLVLCGLWVAAGSAVSRAQTFTILHNFTNAQGGYSYFDNLTQGLDGNLWGTTFAQGAYFDGTAYRITPEGAFTLLADFNSQYAQPEGALALAANNLYYGTTPAGGGTENLGTVFTLDSKGMITVLHSFAGPDGSVPHGPVLLGSDGNLYGTTESGGSSIYGTVFKITPSGTLTTLHSFGVQGDDGQLPEGGTLLEQPNGIFHGVDPNGGNQGGFGVIYQVTSSGNFKVLHNFDFTHGGEPYGTLVLASDGNMYGTTQRGGSSGAGIVFRISTTGTFTVVHNFQFSTDGSGPTAGLVQASDGKLYGTTSNGGSYGYGTIFSITTDGVFSVVENFDFQAVDANGLMQHTNGILYGVTQYGGLENNGVIYSLNVGAPGFAGLVSAFGRVGSQVKILGTGLTGSTAVDFNGTAASFKVDSDSLISATVPIGATSGPVQVTTPTGTVSTKSSFTVLRANLRK